MKLIFASLLGLLLLAGCAATEGETPQQIVFGLKSDYKAVLELAVTYESLPRCPQPDTAVCSEPEVVDLLRKADNHANTALNGAEEVVRSEAASKSTVDLAVESATKALDVFRNVVKEEGLF